LNAVAVDFTVKGRSVNVQNFGTAGDIPAIIRQYLPDVGFFYFSQAIVYRGVQGFVTENGRIDAFLLIYNRSKKIIN